MFRKLWTRRHAREDALVLNQSLLCDYDFYDLLLDLLATAGRTVLLLHEQPLTPTLLADKKT